MVELAATNKSSETTALSKPESPHIPAPMGMNQGADEVIKHLGMSDEIFAEMAVSVLYRSID